MKLMARKRFSEATKTIRKWLRKKVAVQISSDEMDKKLNISLFWHLSTSAQVIFINPLKLLKTTEQNY